MTRALQLGNRTITVEELMPRLASYNMLPQLLRENIIDEAIASFTCTPEETAKACEQFYQRCDLNSELEREAWLERYRMTPKDLEVVTTRRIRIEKFKQVTWGHKLESYFLNRKAQLDQVIFSIIRTKDAGVAQELYFRIQAGEQTFAELAKDYSQGPEVHTGGLAGPVELGTIHPNLAQLLRVSQLGQLWPPKPLGEWLVLVRLEKLIPAQFNDFIRQRLLRELFETWLQEQTNQLSDSDKMWITGANRSGGSVGNLAAA